MEKICEVCGVSGYSGTLMTCRRCNRASEHIYCMRGRHSKAPTAWYCVECGGKTSLVNKEIQDVSKRQKTDFNRSDRQKTRNPSEQSGRSPNRQIQRQNSSGCHGCITDDYRKQTSLVNKGRQDVSKLRKTAVNCSDMKKNRNPSLQDMTHKYSGRSPNREIQQQSSSGRPGYTTDDYRKQTGVLMPSLQNGPSKITDYYTAVPIVGCFSDTNVQKPLSYTKTSVEAKYCHIGIPREEGTLLDNGASGASYRESDQRCIVPLISGTTSNQVCVSSSRVIQGSFDGEHNTLLKCVKENVGNDKDDITQKIKDSGTSSRSGFGFTRVGLEVNNPPYLLVIHPYGELQNCCAQQACWKGNFEVVNVAYGATNHFSGIQAHFPSAVSSKVYEMRNSLPEKFKFKLLPQGDVWPKLFQLEPPDKDDIGLYFFPCEVGSCRSKEKYDLFVERLDTRNLALKTCVAGSCLVILPSNQLPMDSQRINGELYMWGVFHNEKQKKINKHKEVASPLCPIDMSHSRARQKVRFEVPSEKVDMEGGKYIGGIDAPCREVSFSQPDSRDFKYRASPADQFPLKEVVSPIHVDVHLDVPPGFRKLEPPPGFPILLASKQQNISLEAASKKSPSPIQPDISLKCHKLVPPGFPTMQTSKHRSSSHVSTPTQSRERRAKHQQMYTYQCKAS